MSRGGQQHGRKAWAAAMGMMVLLTVPAMGQSGPGQDPKFSAWLSKRPLISEIRIQGNRFFSDAKIKAHLFSRKNSFGEMFRTGSRNRVLRYSAYRDTLEVKYMYLREGFLNIQAAESVAVSGADSTALITLTIIEGNRFLAVRAVLEAPTALPFFNDLHRMAAQLEPGHPADPLLRSKIIFDLKTVFANNGYPYATVQETIDSAAGPSQAVVTFTAGAGPLVHFGGVKVKDLKKFRPFLIRREIAFKPGEVYSRRKIIESQKRLYAMGLFNSINLDIDRTAGGSPGVEPDTLPNFIFSGIERSPHYVSMKTGAGQDPQQDLIWDFSAAWGKRNIFISRRVELSVDSRYIIFTQWRPLSHRFQIQYFEPWFLNVRVPLTLSTRFEPGVRSQTQPYRIQTWGASVSTRKEWSERLIGQLTGEYENVNIYGVDKAEATLIRQEQNISIRRKLTGTLSRDTRLDKFVPTGGAFTTYFVQYVGGLLGGDDSFTKLECSWARYQPAVGRAIYATRIKGGWAKSFGRSTAVPTEDRFYLGGANSIRGFRENSIGPRGDISNPTEDSTNIGANAYAVFNQEIRVPLFWKFWGSVFTDMGNGWESFSAARPENVLFAYGVGLQFLSPAGPIRLDYARRLENGIYRQGHRFHITILYAF